MTRVLALLALLLTLAGCADIKRPPRTTSVQVSYDDLLTKKHINQNVTLAVGDSLRIILASNASTGYQWSAQAQISDPAVVVQRDHLYAAPPGVGPPGSSGTETWTFQALKAGTTTVSTSYSQPWPGGAKDSWTFTASVTVQ
jgi:inhibitor of cysteine peptidase